MIWVRPESKLFLSESLAAQSDFVKTTTKSMSSFYDVGEAVGDPSHFPASCIQCHVSYLKFTARPVFVFLWALIRDGRLHAADLLLQTGFQVLQREKKNCALII